MCLGYRPGGRLRLPRPGGSRIGRPLDLLVAGGRVWTGDPGRARASALGVRGGGVAFFGSAEEARLLADADTDIVEAAGKLLVPGFIDAHNHVVVARSPTET